MYASGSVFIRAGRRRSERTISGFSVHRARRVGPAGHGGQVLVSSTVRDLVDDDLLEGVSLRDLGSYRLKDIDRPERLFQLVIEGVPSSSRR